MIKAILQLGYFIGNLEYTLNENKVNKRSGGYLENQISFNSSCAIGEFCTRSTIRKKNLTLKDQNQTAIS